ncbi:MAG: transposase [Candidatus Delongbacteria bacterium]|nr:transposase [Candidatus Delongbacteria bacterium]
MRRKESDFIKNSVFHIYNHSVEGLDLFKDRNDYLYFLTKLKSIFDFSEIEIYAYCLMPNHFHFCIKQKGDTPIYKVFNRLSTSYAMYFNRRYDRSGHLFAGKLQHIRIEKDQYLITLCQYIHYNPVKAGIIDEISMWEFSNYHEYIGKRKGDLFSKELMNFYSEMFVNYESVLKDYGKYEEDKRFNDLLFEESN